LWLIRVLRLIRGTGVHWIHREARIDHGNVMKAADVLVAAPGPRFVAHRARKTGLRGTHPTRDVPGDRAYGTRATVEGITPAVSRCGLRAG